MQKTLGILILDVVRTARSYWSELLVVVEFVLYKTPGPHGFTPRDIDRRWSVSSSLERELQPFQVGEFEPISEYVAKLFETYRALRVRILTFLKQTADKRAELVNRWRKQKDIVKGAKVVLQDPRHRRAGGRAPFRKPLSEVHEVVEVHGNKLHLRRQDGTLVKEPVHTENVVVAPDSVRDLSLIHI